METMWIVLTQLVLLHTVQASMVNVARGKPASMSSSLKGYKASTAVDGKTYAGRSRHDNLNFVHTVETHTFAWWKVDLERDVQDAPVRIYFRTDYKWRRNGVKLYTSTSSFPTSNPTSQGQLCHTVTGDPSGSDIPDVYNITCPGTWRYLLIYTDTDNDGDGPHLNFGEVEVYECPTDTFGSDCTSCTTRHCQGRSDCPADGTCSQGCQDGWTGNTCTEECPTDTFGSDCTSCTTRHCQGESDCPADGTCSQGCQDGWTGNTCTEVCTDGSYGPDCTEKCGKCDGVCDSVDGRCPAGCLDGYDGAWCDVSLPTPDLGHWQPLVLTAVVAVGCTLLLVVAVLLFLFRHGRISCVFVSWDTNQRGGNAEYQTDYAHLQCRQPPQSL